MYNEMISKQTLFFALLLTAILVLELVDLVAVKLPQKNEVQSFIPMVYENQIYQGVSTDGSSVYSPTFHSAVFSKKESRPILVFRYSGLSCQGCVQICINALRRQWPDFENERRIMFVVSESSATQTFPESLLLGDHDRLGYDLEETHVPHFFVFDPVEQIILHTFVPDQTDTNALRVYLEAISNRYGI